MDLDLIQNLAKPADTKIVLLVLDGLGGIAMETEGLTELEAANTANLDKLAVKSICGLQQPVAAGITPGSGPGHLALFGYDPITYQVGRGVLSALGIDFELTPEDLAARGNFCTVEDDGRVSDRRAGRINTRKNKELCALLGEIKLSDVEVFVEPVKEHRFLLVIRGNELFDQISDTDPQTTGRKPLVPQARSQKAEKSAAVVKQFVEQARDILSEHHPANMILLRGFSKKPDWPKMTAVYGFKAAAIAAYPMYKGVTRLLGMQALETGDKIGDEFDVLENRWSDFDFFYLHIKRIDSAGEDGDARQKQKLIEEVDDQIPRLLDLNPDVLIVTGDHSTPSRLRYHSWHPVPVLLWSRYCRPDSVVAFGETNCVIGGLGPRFPGVDLMPLALAHAMRLEKFGA